MKRFDVFTHDNSRVLVVEDTEGAWVQYKDVAKIQKELNKAKALLKRVFGDGCVFTGSRLGPISDCEIADDINSECRLTNETIPLDGTRPGWCPYRPFEGEPK